jgi:integrase/recombinase XerD
MTARLAVHVVGPLRPYRDGFAEAMRLEGHAEGPVELHSHLLAHLSRWLLERGLGSSDLTPPVLEEFFAGRRTRRRWLATTRAAQPLLRYLRAMDAVPEEVEQPPVTAADELAGAFGNWLVCDRGLAAAPVELVRWARHLTARWWQGGGVVPENLDPATIIALVRDEVERLAAPSARNLLGALRSFLRFLYVTGRTSQPLVAAVPAAAVWRGPQLPRAVPRSVAEDLLEGCDQTTPGGRRDLAVLRLLLRLGLRA